MDKLVASTITARKDLAIENHASRVPEANRSNALQGKNSDVYPGACPDLDTTWCHPGHSIGMMTQHTELELSVKMYLHQDITNARAMLASLRGPLLSAILLACKAFTHEKRIGVAVREQQNWMWLGDGQSKNKIIELVHSMAKVRWDGFFG